MLGAEGHGHVADCVVTGLKGPRALGNHFQVEHDSHFLQFASLGSLGLLLICG